MNTSQRIQVKTNFLASHFINEIAKWIRKNSDEKFFEITKYKQKDLDRMVNLTFDWTVNDMAKISALLGKKIVVFLGDEEEHTSNAPEKEKTKEMLFDFISFLLKEDTILDCDVEKLKTKASIYSQGVIEPK